MNDQKSKEESIEKVRNSASKGLLEFTSKSQLTVENLITPDIRGGTALHYAASHGQLKEIPEGTLKELEPYFHTLLDNNKDTPLHFALHSSQKGKTLKSYLPEIVIAQYHKPAILTLPNQQRYQPILFLAAAGNLGELPESLWENDTQLLLTSGPQGFSPLNYAALNGTIHKFPKQAITQKNLETNDSNGQSSFHNAATSKTGFEDWPKEYLTVENLIHLKNKEGKCAVCLVIQNLNFLKPIPTHVLAAYCPTDTKDMEEFKEALEKEPQIKRALYHFKNREKINKKLRILTPTI